jgi:hypothetical protein
MAAVAPSRAAAAAAAGASISAAMTLMPGRLAPVDSRLTMPGVPRRALLIVGVQVDYFEGGAHPVPDASFILHWIERLRLKDWDMVVHGMTWASSNSVAFVSNNPGAVVNEVIALAGVGSQAMVPEHCVQGTPGAALHPDLFRCLLCGLVLVSREDFPSRGRSVVHTCVGCSQAYPGLPLCIGTYSQSFFLPQSSALLMGVHVLVNTLPVAPNPQWGQYL